MARYVVLLVLLYTLAVNAGPLKKGEGALEEVGKRDEDWTKYSKQYMKRYNPYKYMQGIGKKFGLPDDGSDGMFGLDSITKMIEKKTKEYVDKKKASMKEGNPDIEKKMGDIRGNLRKKMEGTMEGPMSHMENIKNKMKTVMSGFGDKKPEKSKMENQVVEEVEEEPKKDAEESSWSWGKIFNVFGKGINDLYVKSEEEAGKVEDSRRRRSIVEEVDYVAEEEAEEAVKSERTPEAEEYAELGRSLGELVREKGQKYLEDLTQKVKENMSSTASEMRETVEALQDKFQEKMKEPKKNLEKIQEKVKNAVGEESDLSWMKVIGAVAEGLEELFVEDSEEPTASPL